MDASEAIKKLNSYVESFLDEEGYQKFLNKRKKIKKNESTRTVIDTASELPTLSKRKRKKLKKIQKTSENKLGETTTTTTDSVKDDGLLLTGKGKSKNMIQRIKDELDLEKIRDYTSLSTVSSSEQTVLTNNSNSRANPEVVVFPKHPKKKSLHSDRKPDEDNDLSKDRPELDLQKARYEVLKFGISGFEKQRKEEAEIALAIKLGAKPPKNQYVNYKQLIEERKQKKTETNEQSTVNRKLGLRPGNVSQKQRKRNKNAVPRFDPQVGVYRGGIQFIRRKDLDHIKKTSHQKKNFSKLQNTF